MANVIVWAAHGKRYILECIESLNSVLSSNSNIKSVLYTLYDDKIDVNLNELFDEVIYLESTLDIKGYYFKLYALKHIRLDKFLFLDSDTIVLSDISSLFDKLNSCPIIAVADPLVNTFQHISDLNVPKNWFFCDAFGEINTGVIFINKVKLGDVFFKSVLSFHLELINENLNFIPSVVPDQPAFYQAILAADVIPLFVGAHYNFRNCYPQCTYQPIKIVHGHKGLTEAHFKGGGVSNDVNIFFPWGGKVMRADWFNKGLFYFYRLFNQMLDLVRCK